jgi:flagellar biosynthesis regulator FlaF
MSATGVTAPYQPAMMAAEARATEADLFRRVVTGLRTVRAGDARGLAMALADTGRLWQGILTSLAAPGNPLPMALRRNLAELGFAILRELMAPEPDLEFLVEVNEQVMQGLTSSH